MSSQMPGHNEERIHHISEIPGSFRKPVVEDAVDDTNDLSGQDIVKTVCRLKVFSQDQGKEDLTQVADPDHRQLLQQQAC
jgi:hypothetical protein